MEAIMLQGTSSFIKYRFSQLTVSGHPGIRKLFLRGPPVEYSLHSHFYAVLLQVLTVFRYTFLLPHWSKNITTPSNYI
jgi:hypothetical protein